MRPDTFAVRTLRLCTKDCLCLYVCPTGATDTENSVIDISKCTGCGACAASCPSGAISMVPYDYPPQQEHRTEVVAAMNALLRSKAAQEALAREGEGVLAAALTRSSRIQAEDIAREAGFMIAQSDNAAALLAFLKAHPPVDDFPVEKVVELQDLLSRDVS